MEAATEGEDGGEQGRAGRDGHGDGTGNVSPRTMTSLRIRSNRYFSLGGGTPV